MREAPRLLTHCTPEQFEKFPGRCAREKLAQQA